MAYSIGYQLINGIQYFFRIVYLIIMIYCLLSFFGQGTRVYAALDRFIAPLRRPFMPISMHFAQRGFPFDVSIILLWLCLGLAERILIEIVSLFMGF